MPRVVVGADHQIAALYRAVVPAWRELQLRLAPVRHDGQLQPQRRQAEKAHVLIALHQNGGHLLREGINGSLLPLPDLLHQLGQHLVGEFARRVALPPVPGEQSRRGQHHGRAHADQKRAQLTAHASTPFSALYRPRSTPAPASAAPAWASSPVPSEAACRRAAPVFPASPARTALSWSQTFPMR